MSSLKKLGFLALALIVSGQIVAMDRKAIATPNAVFDSSLTEGLLQTPPGSDGNGSPASSDNGDTRIEVGHVEIEPACLDQCLKPIKDCLGLCNAGGKKVNRFLERNPVARDGIKATLFTGASVVASNWGRGEIFPVVFQHFAGDAIQQFMGHFGTSMPVDLAAIGLVGYGFYRMDTAIYPEVPMVAADDDMTNGTYYVPTDDDGWKYNPNRGFESGMAKVAVLAGANRVLRYFDERKEHKD